MRNTGKEQRDRAEAILARMGFTKNRDTDEWLIQDSETHSMVSIVFERFEAFGEYGYWIISPWAAIDSENGAPLAQPDVAPRVCAQPVHSRELCEDGCAMLPHLVMWDPAECECSCHQPS